MSGNSVRDMPFIFDASGHAVGVVNLKGEEQTLAGAGDVLSINNLGDLTNAALARANIGAAAASDLATANTALAAKLAAADLKTINGQSIVGAGGNITITGGSGGGITTVAFSAQVPLDQTGGSEMGAVQATSDIDFVPAVSPAPVVNGNANVTIYPGAGNVTFSGFTNPDGFVHLSTNISHVSFYARPALGGGVGEKLVFGRLGAVYDGGKPTLVSSTILLSNPNQVVDVYSENLSGTLPVASAFPVSGSTVASVVAGGTANIVIRNLAAPAVAGESKTAGYTKPGTNNLKDASGNEVDNYSVAITNNAGALPTITGVAVSDSAAGTMEVTLSQPYTGTLPASSAFAVSAGHPINGIGAGSNTSKINLTTSTPFVFGEAARSLSYTKPATNPITSSTTGQQVATVSGIAIANNVAGASGTIMEDDFSPGSSNIVGRTPALNNTEGNIYFRDGGGGGDIGSDKHISVTNSPWGYPITSRKNYTLDTHVNFVGSATQSVQLRKASGSGTYYELLMNSSSMAGHQVVGGVAGANDFSVSISPGDNYTLQCVMGSDDSLVVKINGTAVTGATATLSGSNYGFAYSCPSGVWYIEHIKAS